MRTLAMSQHYETPASATRAGNQNRPSSGDRISDDLAAHADSDVTSRITEHDLKRVAGEPRFCCWCLVVTSRIKTERIEINVERAIVRWRWHRRITLSHRMIGKKSQLA